MRKTLVLIFTVAVLFSACGKSGTQNGGSAENLQTITFPAYQFGKENLAATEDYINAVYNTAPFDLHIALPAGWNTKLPGEDEEAQAYAFYTIVKLFDGEKYIGYMGFNRFEPNEGEIPQEEYYKTVYPELRLSSMSQWEPYTAVKTTPSGETGIAEVHYLDPDEIDKHPGAMPDVPVIDTWGILSYDKELKAFIGIQFVPDFIDETQVRDIAESIELVKHK